MNKLPSEDGSLVSLLCLPAWGASLCWGVRLVMLQMEGQSKVIRGLRCHPYTAVLNVPVCPPHLLAEDYGNA